MHRPVSASLLLVDKTRKAMDNGKSLGLVSAMGAILDSFRFNQVNILCTTRDSFACGMAETDSGHPVSWVSLGSLDQAHVEGMFLQAVKANMDNN